MAASGGPPPLPPPPATPLARIPLPLVQGTLFRYGSAAANVAFMSGRHPRHVVLVGGLTDGLLFAGYCHPLAARLHAAGWSLVQALLSSCHTGYGLASLDQDADELHQLATHLRAEWGSQVGRCWRAVRLFEVVHEQEASMLPCVHTHTCNQGACTHQPPHAFPPPAPLVLACRAW